MSDVLFQQEIDSLIESLDSGSIKPEDIKLSTDASIKNFDFNRPNKFSREQLMSLDLIHNTFARILSNFLSAYLRSNIRIRVTSVEQLTYEDFVRSIPSPTLITIFSMEPLKRTAIMETNLHCVFPMLDLMFGGKGNVPGKVRVLTEIEMSVIRKLYEKVLENFSNAWSDIFQIQCIIESMETNPRFSQTITPKETVAVITFDFFVGSIKGLMNLCIPFIALDPIMARLSAHYWIAEGAGSTNKQEVSRVEKILSKVKLNLSVNVGEISLLVGDFLRLQEGDVLPLSRKVSEDMDMYLENMKKFKVQPGVMGSRLAVQVTASCEES